MIRNGFTPRFIRWFLGWRVRRRGFYDRLLDPSAVGRADLAAFTVNNHPFACRPTLVGVGKPQVAVN